VPIRDGSGIAAMMSQYRFSSNELREEAQNRLGGLGYDVRSGGADDPDILIVHHPDAYVVRVDDIVFKIDAGAQRR
jgi:hypothetical protein